MTEEMEQRHLSDGAIILEKALEFTAFSTPTEASDRHPLTNQLTNQQGGFMNKELANLTLQFLQRIQLSAQEIPAFMAVKQALEAVQDVVTEERVESDLESK